MIGIESGYENPRKKLLEVIEWINVRFANVPNDQRGVLVDYVNAWFEASFNSQIVLHDTENIQAKNMASAMAAEKKNIKDQLYGYSLRAEVAEIDAKIMEMGGILV